MAYVSWDMFPSMLNNSESAFNVHLDSTGYGARSLSMHGGQNSIQLFNFGKSATLSSLSNQTKYRVLARVDAASDQLEISINGNPVYSGTFGSPDLTSVRMTLSPWKGGATQCNDSAAALSNVLIYEDPSDLETPPAQSIGVTFKLVPGYPTSVSANGGYLSYYRGIQNSGDVPLNLYTWITVDLPDGTGFPLRQSHSVSLQPGASMATVQNGLFIPKWFPAGDYKARMVVVNQVTGEQFNHDIPFSLSDPNRRSVLLNKRPVNGAFVCEPCAGHNPARFPAQFCVQAKCPQGNSAEAGINSGLSLCSLLCSISSCSSAARASSSSVWLRSPDWAACSMRSRMAGICWTPLA
ncbi:hypothetical protein SAMN05421553_1687 [Pseudomonas anguilliseptica]|uniref:RbmA-like FnIII domain-containing protein n=1 Tax=Pseudomonas anguilliseptica TaxID=53406 RepID=A0A1H4WJ50_PSEAG|nr:hypothetical protein SAMN05421553_1687 [Pseudomonas anguilliseptica]